MGATPKTTPIGEDGLTEATRNRIRRLRHEAPWRVSVVIESRKGEAGGRERDLLMYRSAIEVVAVDQDQAETARVAWRRFGKGRHPAALNYGDCFAYALARCRRLPLLLRGDDFFADRHRLRAGSLRHRGCGHLTGRHPTLRDGAAD